MKKEVETKICGACQSELDISAYTKKQWQNKSQRRCKECIASDKPICKVKDAPMPADKQKKRVSKAKERDTKTKTNTSSSTVRKDETLLDKSLEYSKLQHEIEEMKDYVSKLPPCPTYDDKGAFIPRTKQVFDRAEQLKIFYEKVDRLQELAEEKRVDELVTKHQELHPPNTEECPICLEAVPVSSNSCVQFLVCCGNICCYKCLRASVSGGKMKMSKCPMCRSNLLVPPKECVRLTKRCADNGRAWALTQMGIYYLEGSACEHGDAVPYQVDKKEAFRLFKLAAEQGDPDAVRNVAQLHYGLYGTVDGVEKCVVKARSIMKEAADLGNLRAQKNYAMMCRLGQGGPVDEKEAAYYYTLAYSQKDNYALTFHSDYVLPKPEIEEAAYYLGSYYFFGSGEFDRNLSRALLYLEQAARDGNPYENEGQEQLYMNIASCLMERYGLRYGKEDHQIPGHSPIPRVIALHRKLEAKQSKAMLTILESKVKEMCANCGKTAESLPKDGSLKACTRCRSVWYCGRRCQSEHWNDGHKTDCVKFGSLGIPKRSTVSHK